MYSSCYVSVLPTLIFFAFICSIGTSKFEAIIENKLVFCSSDRSDFSCDVYALDFFFLRDQLKLSGGSSLIKVK